MLRNIYLTLCVHAHLQEHCSANKNVLTVVWAHVKAGDNSFAVAAATLWNALPYDIKTSSRLSTSKGRLNTHFFRPSFLAA